MTEIEELRKAFDEAKERIEESIERGREHLAQAEEARLRMLKAAGIPTDDGPRRK
jgi:hypothetical protein